ncbi:MAG: ferric reductase-like transmembrane domain-containing protein [Solirubrobacteraceae bacterium]|nr:ferric reductase-like transmembrane domain-containing protein [Solirubrobacteraceae bacterium]
MLADLSLIWITTRAAGVVALVASSASVILGLALASRVGAGRRRGVLGDVRVLHQTLGIATIVALAVHVGTLLLDPWLQPSIIDLAVPLSMDYRPVWTGLGIVAGYGLLVLTLSGFLRGRAGTRWKAIHRFAGLTWAMSVAHTLGAGTDAGTTWLQAVTGACVVPVVVLLAVRLVRSYGIQIHHTT